jgi:hypothetical protein
MRFVGSPEGFFKACRRQHPSASVSIRQQHPSASALASEEIRRVAGGVVEGRLVAVIRRHGTVGAHFSQLYCHTRRQLLWPHVHTEDTNRHSQCGHGVGHVNNPWRKKKKKKKWALGTSTIPGEKEKFASTIRDHSSGLEGLKLLVCQALSY